mmetsp:Transcript_15971/g.24763  ORF Transcript_15971/g.24763 Transcript_15971/m.24763 type:complete len:126 (+) Transcript_15971:170-547(+)
MGYNIGTRIVDEFFAKSQGRGLCRTFRETVEVIAKEGFKMFLGITCDVSAVPHNQHQLPSDANSEVGQREFVLVLKENPLADFVVLPPQYQGQGDVLWYSNLLCGVIRGSLDMVNMKVNCYFVKD